MKNKKSLIWMIPLGIAGFAAIIAIVMLLWNWLMPDIFGLTTITFWQALGLFALIKILFEGVHGMKHNGHHNAMRGKWAKMTPEQRKEFMNKRHGHMMGHGYHGEYGCHHEHRHNRHEHRNHNMENSTQDTEE